MVLASKRLQVDILAGLLEGAFHIAALCARDHAFFSIDLPRIIADCYFMGSCFPDYKSIHVCAK